MPTKEKTLKTAGKTGLSATIIASKAAKYGLKFTAETAKLFVGGAKNMADQMAPGMNFGIGEFLYDKSVKAADWTIDKAISLQKKAKERLS